jgi:hypothetical protein
MGLHIYNPLKLKKKIFVGIGGPAWHASCFEGEPRVSALPSEPLSAEGADGSFPWLATIGFLLTGPRGPAPGSFVGWQVWRAARRRAPHEKREPVGSLGASRKWDVQAAAVVPSSAPPFPRDARHSLKCASQSPASWRFWKHSSFVQIL